YGFSHLIGRIIWRIRKEKKQDNRYEENEYWMFAASTLARVAERRLEVVRLRRLNIYAVVRTTIKSGFNPKIGMILGVKTP
ncbi:MAG: hypothetical protein J7M01_00450, partial [Candidatus Marinimicrobia bacterium]|nr:hypothetical protein [Candidatus Neomarinimicrobiota bacterium]